MSNDRLPELSDNATLSRAGGIDVTIEPSGPEFEDQIDRRRGGKDSARQFVVHVAADHDAKQVSYCDREPARRRGSEIFGPIIEEEMEPTQQMGIFRSQKLGHVFRWGVVRDDGHALSEDDKGSTLGCQTGHVPVTSS